MARLSVSQPRGFRTRGQCAPPPTRSPAPAEARPHPVLHGRSLNLGLALPGVAAVPERHRVGETSHRGSMAPTRLSALLALALEIWTALSRARGARADPEDEQGQPALGCAAHPRRALKARHRDQSGDRRQVHGAKAWPAFANLAELPAHADGIAALDMFVVPSATFRLLFVMLILAHDRRKIVRFDVTQNPTAGWLSRQVTEAFPWETAPRFLLRDRDASYGLIFTKRVEAMGITEIVTAPRSPWQNAYVERVIGSIRRECLDQVVVFNERHLYRVVSSYVEYYHRSRTHLSLRKDCPDPRPIEPPARGRVSVLPQVGGLHHRYQRLAA